jgi:hypothetical protein
MRPSRFTEEQIIGMLKEQETGVKTADVCRKHGISAGLPPFWQTIPSLTPRRFRTPRD